VQVARQPVALVLACRLQVLRQFGELSGAQRHLGLEAVALALYLALALLLLRLQRRGLAQHHVQSEQAEAAEQRHAQAAEHQRAVEPFAAREFAERSGIAVHCELQPVRLRESAELVVYRLVQEAITNISKYAQARNVWLTLADRGDHVEVSVRDDGVGFDPRSQPPSAHGLMGMRYRAEAERGALTVVSAPGQGTLIRVSLPQAAKG
jgi:signal transduction histidine kinase